MELYRALACVLLEMVILVNPKEDEVPQRLPEPCRKLGMTVEEYRYLTHSALINLGDASTAVVDDEMPNHHQHNNTTTTTSSNVVKQ